MIEKQSNTGAGSSVGDDGPADVFGTARDAAGQVGDTYHHLPSSVRIAIVLLIALAASVAAIRLMASVVWKIISIAVVALLAVLLWHFLPDILSTLLGGG